MIPKTVTETELAIWLENPTTKKILKFFRRESLQRIAVMPFTDQTSHLFHNRGMSIAYRDMGNLNLEHLNTINESIAENYEEIY